MIMRVAKQANLCIKGVEIMKEEAVGVSLGS
jgi:hypothetical protein